MSETAVPLPGGTKIEWCHYTFNPWIGCTRVSDGCKNCYAESMDNRWGGGHWGKTADRRVTSDGNWKKPAQWDRAAKAAGERRRVFCASMADVFEDRDDLVDVRARLFDLILSTPNLDWLLLTKRPENVGRMVPSEWMTWATWPKNVWVGTTIEHQASCDARIKYLIDIPAPVRFLSCEPLLGPVDLTKMIDWYDGPLTALDAIDWVIGGGESGHGARPMHPSWIRSLRDQCAAAGVPFLFKQWGEWCPPHIAGVHDANPTHYLLCGEGGRGYVRGAHEQLFSEHMNSPVLIAKVGKKRAGRLLDGAVHDGYPT